MPDYHTPGMIEYQRACIATGLKSATITLQLLNSNKRTGLPVKKILVRSVCYGIGFWLWINLVAQIAAHFTTKGV